MTKWTILAGACIVSAALITPELADAQARHRGGSGSQSSSGSGSSGSGSAEPRSSGARPAPAAPSGAPSARVESRSGGRPAVARGDAAVAPVQRRVAQPRPAFVRPATGTTHIYYPNYAYYPSYGYYPAYHYPSYYGSNFGVGFYDSWAFGFGLSFGYPIGYPYFYGGFPYGAYPYGAYPDAPYPYVPYSYYRPYAPYSYGGGAYGNRENRDDQNHVELNRDREDAKPTGSLRLRANPREAKVYIDGALVGTVDDFDGLSGHLKLDIGLHQLELRADGYERFETEVSVVQGKTTTERVNLKKLV